VLFLDTIICDLNILKVLESIREKSPKTNVILLTHTQNEEAAVKALSLTVWGYLTVASDITHLINAIRDASKDKIRAEKKILRRGLIRSLSAGRGKLGFFRS
jgi:DNA-binding NtrC family response regulator